MCEQKTELCRISRLIGQPVHSIGRAANMLDLHFGEDVIVPDRISKEKHVGTYSLHVQCPWRIINPEKRKVLLGSLDFYAPSTRRLAAEDFDYNHFDWDVQGENLFDEKAQEWFAGLEHVTVVAARMNRFGDARIDLSNGDRIEIFVMATDDGECWRLFLSAKSTTQLVIYGDAD